MDARQAVGGCRPDWPDLPARIRRVIEAAAGSPVVAAESRPGGFSPGLAAVLRLADGGSVFVKAASPDRNPDTPGMYRREAEVLAGLPAGVPAPRLRWSHDDGEWVVLLIEAVDGESPVPPWPPAVLTTILELAGTLAARLTPAPPVPAPPAAEYFRDSFTGWRTLAGGDPAAGALDPWARRHLDRLAELEAGWEPAAAGTTLVHGDFRADNILLTPAGPVAVDWPHASVGADWLDLLFALPSLAMHGADPQALWDRYPPARTADPEAVTAVLAAAVGYFVHRSTLPAPPSLPRLRAFQRAQGEAGLAWLRRRHRAATR